MKQYLLPQKIIKYEGVENISALLKRKELQIGLTEQEFCTVHAGGYIILDYGKELCGGVRLLTFHSDASKIRIRFGESLSECCSDIGDKQNATNDHATRDFYVNPPHLSDQSYGNTGFRFVRLDFFGEAKIKSVLAESNIYGKRAIYRYSGEDKQIAKIFLVAKHTLDLCASSGYIWDGVKRDRLVWIGDMHPETIAFTTLYGRTDVIERSLDFVRDQTPLPGWMNTMPAYSLWWIIILADYCEYANAPDFLPSNGDYLEALARQINSCIKDDGELCFPSYFVDWPTRDKADEKAGVRAIAIMAAKRAIKMLGTLGRDTSAAEEFLAKLLKKEIKVEVSKQVTALKYMAVGELDEADKARLAEGGAHGMSTFMSYYILKAVASFDKALSVKMMKDFYGAMLDKGATSFWEDFSMDWINGSCRIDEFPKEGELDIHGDFGAHCYIGFRHSLCHGWSAGVIRFIYEELN